MKKENDLVLNMLANPEFSLTDFLSVGLTGENTALESEETYASNDKITLNEAFLDDNGNFDAAKFHRFYMGAGLFYNQLTTQDYNKSVLDQALYSLDNMWVDSDKRTIDYSPKLVRRQNEHLVTSGLEAVGKKGERTKSVSEIAQTQKIYNVDTGKWEDSPNDSFFSNLFTPLVLATYDEDIADEEGNIIHHKGDTKYNDEGLPYYETLGGRDVSGKLVLNKMNVLTTDGSFANKYFDFFDSDDIEQKSLGSTILKNAALVGSMFIPYVGPVITGLSVATLTAGLFATMGKLIAGNDNDFLNNVQGWSKSVNRSASTEYAQTHTWCGENFLNMIGDTIGLLSELRWLFKAAPTLLTGDTRVWKAMSSSKGREKVIAQTEKKLIDAGKEANVKNILEQAKTPEGLFKLKEYNDVVTLSNHTKAIELVDKLVEKGMKFSSPISKAYMTGITVLDTYGEAKLAGASDMEAALLTIGYAAGEAALLNTGLGEWIMPELKGNNFKFKAIAKALTEEAKEVKELYVKDKSKEGFIKSMLNIGKKIATNQYAEQAAGKGFKTGLDVVAAHAAGEAFEEVSEEVLADVSKSIFNVTRWLRGEDSLDLGEWLNMGDRYGMSALGGFIGGGITSAGTDFNVARNLASMDKTKAMQELLYIINNGLDRDFLKSIDSMVLGDKNLSTDTVTTDEGVFYKEGSKEDNLDTAIKTILKKQVSLMKDFLNSEGAAISKDSMLNRLTLEDLERVLKNIRLNNLLKTNSMGLYLLDYLNLLSEIVSTKAELYALEHKSDQAEDDDTTVGLKKLLNEKLKGLLEQKDAYLNGEVSVNAIRDALFEMNPVLNSVFMYTNVRQYAKEKLGKEWETLSDEEKKSISEKLKNYSETDLKNDVHTRASMFYDMLELSSPFITLAQELLAKLDLPEYVKVKETIQNTSKTLKALSNFDINSEDFNLEEYIDGITATLENIPTLTEQNLTSLSFSPEIIKYLEDLKEKPVDDNYTISLKLIDTRAAITVGAMENMQEAIAPFLKLGYINPEVKKTLLDTLLSINDYIEVFIQSQESLSLEDDLEAGKFDYDYKIQQTEHDAFEAMQVIADYGAILDTITKLTKQVKDLKHSPIIEYLKQFQFNSVNSDLDITKHWETTELLFLDAKLDLSDFTITENWEEDNQEALKLLNGFIAVIEGAKIDNADLSNPTGFSRIMNNVALSQGIKDYVPLAELDTDIANQILLDAYLLKDRFIFAENLFNANKGLKLKQQLKVASNKNLLLYNGFLRLINVIPDDWIADTLAIQELKGLNLSTLENYAKDPSIKLNKDLRNAIEAEMFKVESAINKVFKGIQKADGSFNEDKLSELLHKFAGSGGFFAKTSTLLTEKTKSLDDNAFIWWLASRATLDSTAFHLAYIKSLGDTIAPVASLELAIYLGTAAITNMNGLNSFVRAYRNTVIKDFNNLDEASRKNLLTSFDGSVSYASKLLKYFGGHNVLPLYQNMVFIEGIPGSGKTKGVFAGIKAVVDLINPDLLKNVIYAHATEKSAEDAMKNLGMQGKAFDRTSLCKYISNLWEDILNIDADINKGQTKGLHYLKEDSYAFDKLGKLVNTWKLNKYSTDSIPKIMFIDEVTHYNQLELSMIELFALENGIVVLTAGDLDLDTQEAYIKIPEFDGDIDLTISRNSFIRTPKLGVSLRTLNHQMTYDVSELLRVHELIENNKHTSLNLHYLDDDPIHKGLYGVKTINTSSDELTDEELDLIMKSVKLMVETSKEKIGYIYHDTNSKLYKALTSQYADKLELHKDSSALGLESQYYIVETDRNLDDPNTFFRHLNTGITRAELGALVIAPFKFLNIEEIRSSKDSIFQLEHLSDKSIKKSSELRKEQLTNLLKGLNETPLTIQSPTIIKQDLDLYSKENVSENEEDFPEPLENTAIPEVIDNWFTDKNKAQLLADVLKNKLGDLKNVTVHDNSTNKDFSISEIKLIEDEKLGLSVYKPIVVVENNEGLLNIDLPTFEKDFTIKNTLTDESIPSYNIGAQFVIRYNNKDVPITILNIDNINPITYTVTDGTTAFLLTEDLLKAAYVGPIQVKTDKDTDSTDTFMENGELDYEKATTNNNSTEFDLAKLVKGKHINHIFYTHNTFETGIRKERGKAVPNINPDLPVDIQLAIIDQRIDSGIGLMKLLGSSLPYDTIIKDLAYLRNLLFNIEDNAELANIFKNFLQLKGDVEVKYAFKSSAGAYTDSNNPKYLRYYIDPDTEELLFILSDTLDSAKRPMRKKLVAIVKEDGKNVFELPIGAINSPLTLLDVTKNGKRVFEDAYNTFIKKYNEGLKSKDAKFAMFDAINEVIKTYDNTDNLELVDLFKLWQFTSNGIFYFDSDFNLASNLSRGPELVKNKGSKLFNDDLQFTSEFTNLEDLASIPGLHMSSILISRKGFINNTRHPKLKPGHAFVLLSNDDRFTTNLDLVNQYLKLLKDPSEPVKVTPWFIVPPKTDVKTWLLNQHNIFEKKAKGYKTTLPSIGNQWTAYRVLESLIETNTYDTLESSDDVNNDSKEAIRQEVKRLQAIEDKWNAEDIVFEDNLYNGRTEKDIYEELKNKLNEKLARYYMRILELQKILESVPNWNTANVTSNKTVALRFNSYLTNIVWYKYMDSVESRLELLDTIQKACESSPHPLTDIYYKFQYSAKDIGPFTLIVTGPTPYSLGNVVPGQDTLCKINAGIHTPNFICDAISDQLHLFTSAFFFDSLKGTYSLTKEAVKKYEDEYLDQGKSKHPKKTVAEEVQEEYKRYFNSGVLDKSILENSSLSKKELLIGLVTKYNDQSGNFGFIYNNKLILTRLHDSQLHVINFDNPVLEDLGDLELTLKDPFDSSISHTVYFNVDDKGNVNEVFTRPTILKLIDVTDSNKLNVSDSDNKLLLDAINKYLESLTPIKRKMSPLSKYLSDSIENLLSVLDIKKATYTKNAIALLFKPLLDFIKNPENKLDTTKINNIIEEILKYIDALASYNVTVDDIVRTSTGTRYRVTYINGADIKGIEIDSNNNLTASIEYSLSDDDKKDLKREDRPCNPLNWNLI